MLTVIYSLECAKGNNMKEINVRQMLEDRERSFSAYASRSTTSKGRKLSENKSALRTEFQRDRDRIIHTKAFRRLNHKTQVFISPIGDHYTTRLTHTLEVSQIARTIARALNLNEDLTEAIALGHDMGHTPFGHVGEEVIGDLIPGGFRHNHQSLRIVDILAKSGEGLNLTYEVRMGIKLHSKPRSDIFRKDLLNDLTLEGQAVRISDAIAYLNHDIGDATRAGILKEDDLPPFSRRMLGGTKSNRINTMVTDIVESSSQLLSKENSEPNLTFSNSILEAFTLLRNFMFQEVYLPVSGGEESTKSREILTFLFSHFEKNPDQIPSEYWIRKEPITQMVVDYVSGMTDRYALRTAENLSPGITGNIFLRII